MAQFSIQSDITPMKGTYFRKLSNTERNSLGGFYGPAAKQQQNETFKILQAIDAKRDRDLAYQISLERLQREREDAQRKRDEDERLAGLSKTLGELAGGDKSPDESRAALADFRLQNPGMFKGQGAAALYGAAQNKVTADEATRAKALAEEEKDIRKNIKIWGSDPDKLREKLEKDGLTPMEEEALEAVKWNYDEAKKLEAQKREYDYQTRKVKNLGDRIANTEKLFDEITTAADEEWAQDPNKPAAGSGVPVDPTLAYFLGDKKDAKKAQNIRKLKNALAEQENIGRHQVDEWLKDNNITDLGGLLRRVEENNARDKEQWEEMDFALSQTGRPMAPQQRQQPDQQPQQQPRPRTGNRFYDLYQ